MPPLFLTGYLSYTTLDAGLFKTRPTSIIHLVQVASAVSHSKIMKGPRLHNQQTTTQTYCHRHANSTIWLKNVRCKIKLEVTDHFLSHLNYFLMHQKNCLVLNGAPYTPAISTFLWIKRYLQFYVSDSSTINGIKKLLSFLH